MSYIPMQNNDKSFFTLARGNTSWNDVIESNTRYVEKSGDTIQTKNSLSVPMFAECSIAYEDLTQANVSGRLWSFSLNSGEDQYKWGCFRGWRGGSYISGDDKSIGTSSSSFTYAKINDVGSGNYTTRMNDFSSILIFFPESV